MNPNEPNVQEEEVVVDEATRIRRAGHTRRAFLFKLSLALNGIVGAVMAVPIVGYILGSATKSAAEEKSADCAGESGNISLRGRRGCGQSSEILKQRRGMGRRATYHAG